MIKIINFDLGNVILPFDVFRLANRLTNHSPYSAEQIISKIWNAPIAARFETGRMSGEEYYNQVTDICQFKNLSFEEFIPLFNDIFDQDHDVIELIQRLKSNYKLGLISNTNPIHASHIQKVYTHISRFDKVWFSNEAGVRKPDTGLFKMMLDHFDVEPHETVFIDDMGINVESARSIGINAIQFKNAQQLEKDLLDLGVGAAS